MPTRPVPALRRRLLNDAPLRPARDFVLYWMVAFRRVRSNFSLERALALGEQLNRPVLVLEALRCDYPYASVRLHRFVLQGMAENARRCEAAGVRYYPYVEPARGEGKGLLAALGAHACAVVTDDFPTFFLPRMVAAAGGKLDVQLEAVDSNGLLPLRATSRVFTTAHSFRVFLQKELAAHLREAPRPEPLSAGPQRALAKVPQAVLRRWPAASPALLRAEPAALAALPLDSSVGPAALDGGSAVAEQRLARFVGGALEEYPEERNQPEVDGTSKLSPYLHFGHLSSHQVLSAIARAEQWRPDALGKSVGGAREGWWKMSPGAEAYLDQAVTWRELGYNFCSKREDYARLESLPSWALATLKAHEKDPRPVRYSIEQLAGARTHDPLWNAAQRQLSRDGWFHNYLRMLWGKKILEWSATAGDALKAMVQLMDRLSLDGRNPNSYSGYFWVLGRYDRPWGPERPIFGTVRYMSSQNTARKLRVKAFLQAYAERPEPSQQPLL